MHFLCVSMNYKTINMSLRDAGLWGFPLPPGSGSRTPDIRFAPEVLAYPAPLQSEARLSGPRGEINLEIPAQLTLDIGHRTRYSGSAKPNSKNLPTQILTYDT